MRAPQGQEMWITGTYQEIGPVEWLVKTVSPADAEGNVVGMQWMPLETLVTLKLEDEGKSRTRMTLWHAGLPQGRSPKPRGREVWPGIREASGGH